jgi:hypothetical protein
LNLITDSDNALPFAINNGSTDTFYVSRGGTVTANGIYGSNVYFSGDIELTGGGSITTTTAGNIQLNPDTTGVVSYSATASVVATSYTETSGILWHIINTPASGNATIMQLEAQGANWDGGAVLKLITDDVSCVPLRINNGSTDTFTVTRSGGIQCAAITNAGDITLTSGGSIISTSNGDISIVPNGTGVFMVGTGTPGHLTPTSGEMYVQGISEFDSAVYCDSTLTVDGNLNTKHVVVSNNYTVYFGSAGSNYAGIKASSGNDQWVFLVGSIFGRNIVFGEYAYIGDDFGHSVSTDPTIWLHSANDPGTNPDEWMSFAHDQTNAVFATGTGAFDFTSDILLKNDVDLRFGTLSDCQIRFSSNQTIDTLTFGLDDAARSIIFCEASDRAQDFDHAAQTHPTIFIQSNLIPTTDNGEYAALAYDGITQGTMETDRATYNYTITASSAYASATGSNRDGGDVVFVGGTAAAGGVSGMVKVGTGSPSIMTEAVNSLYVANEVEITGTAYLRTAAVLNDQAEFYFGSSAANYSAFWSDTSTDQLILGLGSELGRQFVIGERAYLNSDYGFATPTDPTQRIYSATDPSSDGTEYAEHAWDIMGIGGSKGSRFTITAIEEEITISTGTATKASTGSLAPADSLIWGASCRVTQAPGGGATIWDLTITGGGGSGEELIQDAAVALGTQVNSAADNDGTQLPIANGSAATVTVNTDVNVLVSDMKVRVVIFYAQFTEPTS